MTVFDRMPEAGGLLAYGIPPYRLPREVLRKQIEGLERTGVRFSLRFTVDKDRFAELARTFDAVFVASGAWQETQAGILGEDCLQSGVEFLRGSELERMAGKTVGIIGGGNTAIDVARSLLRVGAHPVVFYRRTKDEMPALKAEVEKAEEEGVTVLVPDPARGSGGGRRRGGSHLLQDGVGRAGRKRPAASGACGGLGVCRAV